MSDQANIVGKVTTDVTQSVRAAGEMRAAFDKVGASFVGLDAKAKGLFDSVTDGLSKFNFVVGGAQKALQLASAAIGTAKFAADLKQTERRMGELGVSVDSMSKAVDGAVKRTDLMKFALQQLQGETALTRDQMQLVLETADALGDQGLGETMKIAEDLATALKGGATRALRQYNIALDDLGEGQDRVNKLLDRFRDITRNNVKTDAAVENIERMTASFGDFWDGVKRGTGEIVGYFGQIGDAAGRAYEAQARAERSAREENAAMMRGLLGTGGGFAGSAVAASRGMGARYILEQAQSAGSSFVQAYKTDIEVAMKNKPAGWFNVATNELFLATNAFGRGVARNYDKALEKAMEHRDYEPQMANMIGSVRTYSAGDEIEARRREDAFSLQSGFRETQASLLGSASELSMLSEELAAIDRLAGDLREKGLADWQQDVSMKFDVMATSVNLAGDAFWNLGEAMASGNASLGQFLRDLSKGVLGMGKEAAFKALYYLAEGWAKPWDSARSFTAAKFYATAAAVAVPTAAVIGALAGSTGGGGASPSSPSAGGFAGPTLSGSPDAGGFVINVQGNLYGDPPAFGRAISDALDEAHRSGRSRLRSNNRYR